MNKTELYSDKLIMKLPEGFECMNEEETVKYFFNHKFDYPFISREKNSVIGVVVNDTPLVSDKVDWRANQYYATYSRMTPGFVMGEMKIKSFDDVSIAMFSFKSNAPERDLFNIVAVSNFLEKELFILASCDMKDVEILMPEFIKMIDQIEIRK